MRKPLGASFWQQMAGANQPRRVTEEVRALLACPDDDAPLAYHEKTNDYSCPHCNRRYAEESGILPIMPSADLYVLKERELEALAEKAARDNGEPESAETRFGPLWAKALGAAGELRGKRVLEIGCGSGWLTAELAGRGAVAVGLDAVAGKGGLADAAARRQPPDSDFELLRGDAVRLPFLEESFDAVFTVDLIHGFPRPERLLKEVGRVLKTNGVFLSLAEPVGPGAALGDPRTEGRQLSLGDYRGIFAEGGLALHPVLEGDPPMPPANWGWFARTKYNFRHRATNVDRLLIGRPRKDFEPGEALAEYLQRGRGEES